MICEEMGIIVSHDSVNRLLNHIFVEDEPDIDTIGVDDVCLPALPVQCRVLICEFRSHLHRHSANQIKMQGCQRLH